MYSLSIPDGMTSMHDELEDLPRLRSYLQELPDGLDSHPECTCKGSIVGIMLAEESDATRAKLCELPAPLASMVRNPPVATSWVPEAHMIALHTAVLDLSGHDEPQARETAKAVNRSLFSTPMYRALGLLLRPDRLVRHAGSMWGTLHRGTQLTWSPRSGDTMPGLLTYPDYLVPRAMAVAWSTAMEALAELGGPKASCEVHEVGKNQAVFQVRWL